MNPLPASLGSPIVFARALQVAREAGLDRGALRELQGHEAWTERPWIWDRIMRAIRVDGFPIRVAKEFSVAQVGEFGVAAQTASDLRAAFERLLIHQHVLTGMAVSRMRDDAARGITVLEQLPVEGGGLGARCRREMMMASGLQLARDVTGVWVRPRRVCFAHPRPRDSREHEAFFDCEVRFEAGCDALWFDHEDLALPLPGADPDLSLFLVEHLRAASGDMPPPASLEGRVRQAIYRRLGSGSLAMAAVARELGMSPRTLRRHLLERGSHFHEIVDAARREFAEELLGNRDHKLSEIAFLLGFSDASSFHRAYVRWTGSTPATRRRAPRGA